MLLNIFLFQSVKRILEIIINRVGKVRPKYRNRSRPYPTETDRVGIPSIFFLY